MRDGELHTVNRNPPAAPTLADVQAAVAKLRELQIPTTPCDECGRPTLTLTADGFVERAPAGAVTPEPVLLWRESRGECLGCGRPKA